jgi:hypothetical protein
MMWYWVDWRRATNIVVLPSALKIEAIPDYRVSHARTVIIFTAENLKSYT